VARLDGAAIDCIMRALGCSADPGSDNGYSKIWNPPQPNPRGLPSTLVSFPQPQNVLRKKLIDEGFVTSGPEFDKLLEP
jgi:hypothetical protein